jgi:tetratricopeptide (TPR) repeat protein
MINGRVVALSLFCALPLSSAMGQTSAGVGAPTGVYAVSPGTTVRSDAEIRALIGQGKVSPLAAAPLRAAYDDIKAKKWSDAIDKCKQVQTVVGLLPFDKFMVDYFLAIAYYRSGDIQNAAASYDEAAQSMAAPDDLRDSAILSAVETENDAKHPQKVVPLVEMADKAGIADEKIYDTGALADYTLGNDAEAVVLTKKAVAAAEKSNAPAAKITYDIMLNSQSRMKDAAGEIQTLETLCTLYGDKEDWGSLIDVTLGGLSENGRKSAIEVAALYIYRLRLITGASTDGNDYVLIGQLALGLNSPGDAQRAIHAGLASGALAGNATADKILVEADKRAANDAVSMTNAETAAAKSKSGDGYVSLGEAYFGYGRFDDAARMAQAALAKGGKKKLEAEMLLGASKAMAGDKVTSLAAFGGIAGDPSMVSAAHLWSLYVERRYGSLTPQPAATHS